MVFEMNKDSGNRTQELMHAKNALHHKVISPFSLMWDFLLQNFQRKSGSEVIKVLQLLVLQTAVHLFLYLCTDSLKN